MGQARVVMYCTRFCPYCVMAERLLAAKGMAVEKVRVDARSELRIEMERRTGRRTVPQIFIGNTHVGGFTELARLERQGELDALLWEADDRTGSGHG
jgi:glutaredoxin 3